MGGGFQGRHLRTCRLGAVKVIHREHTSESMLARFDREVRVAASIATEHIVQVLDSGKDPSSGSPYMVMELLQGEDVGQLLSRLGPIPIDLALRITAQACIGLEKAHQAGIVHRDIKPANLFLNRREDGSIVVKVLDFGIAKLTVDPSEQGETQGLTRTGAMLGTPLYMSPEQARSLKHIDHRS